MDPSLLDHPAILPYLFHPRRAKPGTSRLPNVTDGSVPITDDISLGYRLYRHESGKPVIVYFHGNGEIAPDYDHVAGEFRRAGASLIVMDYRGYGWSTGTPLASAILPDAHRAADALPGILAEAGLVHPPLFLMGRSLGSAPAIDLAAQHPDRYKGLIIESGFAEILSVLTRMGLSLPAMKQVPAPFGNVHKLAKVALPLLVIHGEHDQLIPVSHGQTLYDASPAEDKRLLRIPYAGHNDIMMVATDDYFAAIRDFMQDVA